MAEEQQQQQNKQQQATTAAGPGTSSPATPLSSSEAAIVSKFSVQIKKLTEANGKYKSLLKLAKDRIQQQEEELEELRQAKAKLEELQASSSQHGINKGDEAQSLDDALLEKGDGDGSTIHIVRVCQRVKVPSSSLGTGGGSVDGGVGKGGGEIWALMEMEPTNHNIINGGSNNNNTDGNGPAGASSTTAKRYKEWKRFDTESQLQDFLRRDTGEPLTLPAFSLTPEQSSRVQKEAKLEVAAVTEDFRRFRVKSELTRKQADAQIRDLQNAQKQSAAQRIINGGSTLSSSSNANLNGSGAISNGGHYQPQQSMNGRTTTNSGGRSSLPSTSASSAVSSIQLDASQVEKMRAELTLQENYWKEAYDTLLAENTALKSSGSEALLASQWRQRYEQSQKEKEELQLQFEQLQKTDDAIKYEAKYRDLKETFRMYRKKAKELFDTTAPGAAAGGVNDAESALLRAAMADGSADAKLSYLRNLMVNYLTAEVDVKNHMEGAIGTLLQFSQDDVARIEKKRAENESWLF